MESPEGSKLTSMHQDLEGQLKELLSCDSQGIVDVMCHLGHEDYKHSIKLKLHLRFRHTYKTKLLGDLESSLHRVLASADGWNHADAVAIGVELSRQKGVVPSVTGPGVEARDARWEDMVRKMNSFYDEENYSTPDPAYA